MFYIPELSENESAAWNIARSYGIKGQALPARLTIGRFVYVNRMLTLAEASAIEASSGKACLHSRRGASFWILPGYIEGLQEWIKKSCLSIGAVEFSCDSRGGPVLYSARISALGLDGIIFSRVKFKEIPSALRGWMQQHQTINDVSWVA